MASRDLVTLSIVGFGKIAAKHKEVFDALGVQVVSSCNRSRAGRERARAAGISMTFDNIEEMIESSKPDAVLCSASIHENFEAAQRVLPFGVPTLLEKPPGILPEQLELLISLSRLHGTRVMLGLNRLHYSVLEKALLEVGGIENLTSVAVEWSEAPAHLRRRGFSEPEILRRNCSNSIHGLSLLTHLAGPIETPQITVARPKSPFGFEMALQGCSARGTLVTFRSSWTAPSPWRLVMTTDQKTYEFAPLETCRVFGSENRLIPPSPEDQRFKPGFHRQAERFLQVVRTGRVLSPYTLESFRSTMALADALSRNIESQCTT